MSFRIFRLPPAIAGIVLLVLTGNYAACAPQKLPTVVLEIRRAGVETEAIPVAAEIAETEDERARGLMFRKKLPDGEGMLFVFDRDQQLSFWMKNTLIPLSIAFIASDGRIVEIRDMEPQNLNAVQSSRSVRYALEVPLGWFGRVGIKTGDILTRLEKLP